MAVLAHLLHLEKIHKKIHSKEYYFVEQGLYKLEAEETEVAKTGSNPTVVETVNTSMVYLLPLTDLFFFGFSFF